MEYETFQAWLAEADGLSARQRDEAARVLAEPASLVAVLALLGARRRARGALPWTTLRATDALDREPRVQP